MVSSGKEISSHIPYDICVLTAANEHQAQGYRKQLEWRFDKGCLPSETEFLVFADPQGKRIGSGGSTIYVLYRLLERFCRANENGEYEHPHELFRGKRILILHSGGDSKRLPAYSAVGKIFVPLPTIYNSSFERNERTNIFVTLFDLLLDSFAKLPRLRDGQVVVGSGDVLLNFDASGTVFSDLGVTGLAYPGPVEVASNHGVYVVPQNSSEDNPREVMDFLQKPTYDELKESNGLDIADRAFVDTGIMNFGPNALRVLMETSGVSLKGDKVVLDDHSLCRDILNARVELDIYREIPFAMLGKNGQVDPAMSLGALRQIPFLVNLVPYCEFFHIGTSRHLLQNFNTINYTASIYDFQNFSKSKVVDKSGFEDVFVYNSLIDTTSVKAEGPSFIEGCCIDGELRLEGENILTNIPASAGNIRLEKGICLNCVPVSNDSADGWASVIYGVGDNFKKLAGDDDATFLNRDLHSWMESRGISTSDLWGSNEPQSLWNAHLFPFDSELSESILISLSLQDGGAFQPDVWRDSYRMSLQEILQSVDYERFLNNCSSLCEKANLECLETILTPESNLPAEEILSWCRETDDYDTAAAMTVTLIERTDDMLFQARLYKLLSNVLKKADDAGCSVKESVVQQSCSECEDMAFQRIREAIGKGLKDRLEYGDSNMRIGIRSDEVVWACAPARLDFAGGWSDTPPYCLEHGGSVLNAAVKLNGQYPIQAIGKLHPEPFIRINSIDLREHLVVPEISEMLSFSDPGDWAALPKAAFAVTGIIPQDDGANLKDVLKNLGGGIDLTLFSAVPSGSGLGTSSILGSAIIACLSRMLGQDLSHEELFNRTLYMEQLMTTGGGWQDQIGGVVGGVKHIQTEPSLFQVPEISWTDLRVASDRFLLYYTGYRRMAKNILRNIVGKYLDRDEVTLGNIAGLREKSFEMKEALDRRNIDVFGAKVAEVWELNKTLDPGTSNGKIEEILARIGPFVHGTKLLGAGGGGFLFIVTKGEKESHEVREILGKSPPNDRARFFDFDVEPEGLKVNVL